MRTLKLALVGLVASAGMAGCGDDDGGEPLTKAAFVTRANAICAASEQRIESGADRYFTEQGKVPTAEQLNDFATKTVIPEVKGQIREIGDLEAPRNDERRVEEILDAAREAVDKVQSFAPVLQSSDPFARYGELAGDYGLEACSRINNRIEESISGV